MNRNLFGGFLALLSLSACHGGDTDSGHETDTNETGETDTNVDGFALVTVNVFRLDTQTADSLVSLTGPKDYTLQSGATIDVDAPGEYDAEVGETVAPFTFPVDVDQNGNAWAAPILTFPVQIDVPSVQRLEEFKLFEPGRYSCEYDNWWYNASAPNHKGAFDDHYNLDEQSIEMDHDGKVHAEDNPDMDILGDDNDYMYVDGDQLILQLVNPVSGDDWTITDSQITRTSFSVTVETAVLGAVSELQCNKR